jgi:uncharacterized protein YecT (DUF1311 family)
MSVEEVYERLRDEQEILIVHRRHLLSQKSRAWVEERWQDCLNYKRHIDRVDRDLADVFTSLVRLRLLGGAA